MMSGFSLMYTTPKSITIEFIHGAEDVSGRRGQKTLPMHYQEGIPGVIWFDHRADRVYEILDYSWDGPEYQNVVIQDNHSNTVTRRGRKGRFAGAVIGTILMPGVGTVIGAAIGTGRRERSRTRNRSVSHVETKEIPVPATMRLRELATDRILTIGFSCNASLDANIRNTVAANLEPLEAVTYIHDIPEEIPQITEKSGQQDVLAQIRELKELLDEGAITKEEYIELKKHLI